MRNRILAAGVACLAMGAGVTTAPASAGPGAGDRVFFELPFPTEGDVTGRVMFPDGTAVSGAIITVNGSPDIADFSDRFGRYSIDGIDSPLVIINAAVLINGTVFTGTTWAGPGGSSSIIVQPMIFPPGF